MKKLTLRSLLKELGDYLLSVEFDYTSIVQICKPYLEQEATKRKRKRYFSYSLNKPCPHCGGNTNIANPTGKCSHIHFPEGVNKKMIFQGEK